MRTVTLLAIALLTSLARSQPNIIYILADDLGYADLASYGQQTIATPNIDRLATEGIRFTNHYAGSTVCAPSRCSLMTGLTTGHCFIRGNARIDLRPDDTTVAELLASAGYATALIGKWGLGTETGTGHPLDQGFDHFFGYLDQRHAHNYYPEYLIRERTRKSLPNEVPDNPRWNMGAGKASKKVAYSHDLFIDDARDWITTQAADTERPFFLYLALTIPHANNEAGNEGMEVPDFGPFADKPWPAPQKGFAGMVHRLDQSVGQLLDLLAELDIDEDTIVIFSSDNGPHAEGGNKPEFFNSNGNLRGIKRDLYDGGIRVPMLARWPGTIEPGTTTDHLSAFWDILPTLCDLAAIPTPEGLDGISLAPTLRGSEDQPQHDYLYWEFFEQGGKQAVRFEHYKAIRLKVRQDRDAPIMLFDLAEDPGEQTDIAADHPDLIERARALLAAARTDSKQFRF
jgi:arylsulfatase A-like enzyme